MVAAALATELRTEQQRIAERATGEMLTLYGAFQFTDVDATAPAFIEASVSVADRFHREASALGGNMYLSMRRDAGVAGHYVVARPEFDAVQLRRDLIALGPVAAKKLMSRGVRIPDAAKRVFTMSAGRVATASLAGVRDTITASTVDDSQAVAYARQTQSDACDFCLTMAENTYRSAQTAQFASGGRRRAKAPQPAGSTFHDHCRCTVLPLFRGEIAPGARDRQAFLAEWATASRQGTGFREFIEQKEGFSLGF